MSRPDEELAPDEEPLDPDAPYDAGDRRHVKERARKQTEAERRRDEVTRALLSQPNGREWLVWLVEEVCGYRKPSANLAYDAGATFWREGCRAVGQRIEAEALRVNREAWIKALGENLE